ncbi:hypothetical protein HU230_0000840 [Bradyrhizobium quebecense]|uniref:Uncharacterized protein n=1 Tax=Bradyrhizobium quebecense TaxID=2748629 RepID=A0A974AGU0_9BRAD|nr:hypothetical protein [Bradyrhizobium quebecense]UGA44617.1 hypothetical protein HU230_0000840 [Bradyrhizobium quebecense]
MTWLNRLQRRSPRNQNSAPMPATVTSTMRDCDVGQYGRLLPIGDVGISKAFDALYGISCYRGCARRSACSANALSRFVALRPDSWIAIDSEPNRKIIKIAFAVSLVIAEAPNARWSGVERDRSVVALDQQGDVRFLELSAPAIISVPKAHEMFLAEPPLVSLFLLELLIFRRFQIVAR